MRLLEFEVRSIRLHVIAILSLILLCPGGRLVSAQPSGNGVRQRASGHLSAGQQALQQNSSSSLAIAQREIEAAYTLEPKAMILELLGQVADRQGAKIAAADLYRRYLEESAPTNPPPEYGQRIQEYEPQSAEVAVDGPEGAFLRVDKRLVGRLPLSLPLLLAEGSHELGLEVAGSPSRTYGIKVIPTEPLRITFPRSNTDVFSELPATVVWVLYETALRSSASAGPLDKAIGRALRRNGQFHVVTEERVAKALRAQPANCLQSAACRLDVARGLRVRYLLEVKHRAGSASLSVQVVDAEVGQVSASAMTECDDCASPANAERLEQMLATALGQAMSRLSGELRIASQPSGAAIVLDGEPISGKTPQSLKLFIGPRTVLLRARDYLPQSISVTIAAGAVQSETVTLSKNPLASRRRHLAIGKWILLGASVLAIAGGGVAIAMNKSTRSDDDAPKFLSWPFGIGAFCLGGLLAGGAGILWGFERSIDRHARQAEQ